MPTPTCPYCERAYSDRRGCEYLDSDPRPLPYGDETDAYAALRGLTARSMTQTPTCSDCAAPKGTLHHSTCLKAECSACHHQFGLCGGTDCDEVWQWSTGGSRPAA